jgi:hypothetical protein
MRRGAAAGGTFYSAKKGGGALTPLNMIFIFRKTTTTYASIGNKHFSVNNVIVRLTKIMNRADKNWPYF